MVIEGKKKVESGKWEETELLEALKKELGGDKSTKEISAELAEASGWNKRDVYNLTAKHQKG